MRVLQVGGGLDLGEEPLGADDGGELRAQHLDGHLAIVLDIVGEVDGGHAARAEFPLDAVAVGKGGAEPVEGAHRAVPCSAKRRRTSVNQLSTTTGSGAACTVACRTTRKCCPSRDTS